LRARRLQQRCQPLAFALQLGGAAVAQCQAHAGGRQGDDGNDHQQFKDRKTPLGDGCAALPVSPAAQGAGGEEACAA